MLLPVAPLLLTTFSVEQLIDRVLKALLLSADVAVGPSAGGRWGSS